jgi:hypothetical protein
MKSLILLYTTTILIWLLFSIGFTASRFSRQGFYISSLDFIYCTTRETCVHEQAHRLDHLHGDISLTDDFAISVTLFAIQHPECVWSPLIMAHATPWHEVYAQMYGSVDGNIEMIPQDLQRFYLFN